MRFPFREVRVFIVFKVNNFKFLIRGGVFVFRDVDNLFPRILVGHDSDLVVGSLQLVEEHFQEIGIDLDVGVPFALGSVERHIEFDPNSVDVSGDEGLDNVDDLGVDVSIGAGGHDQVDGKSGKNGLFDGGSFHGGDEDSFDFFVFETLHVLGGDGGKVGFDGGSDSEVGVDSFFEGSDLFDDSDVVVLVVGVSGTGSCQGNFEGRIFGGTVNGVGSVGGVVAFDQNLFFREEEVFELSGVGAFSLSTEIENEIGACVFGIGFYEVVDLLHFFGIGLGE